ncbi:hypothetical protein H9P43_006806 [Blastocladiella emersonii ATCC 22665]|nr:hypothetical protein H9P43_006806 [Blastocladiella emersonii ATCC 22665]
MHRDYTFQSGAEFMDALQRFAPNFGLASLLLTASRCVPRPLYHVYSLFMREGMPDDLARELFFNALDPAWKRDWVR